MAKSKQNEGKATAPVDVVANTSQGGDTQKQEEVTHVVTSADLESNPDLVGVVEVGQEIGLGDVTEANEQPKQKKYIVANPFSDLHDISKKYEEGDDVSHFSQERLQSAINRGLVKEG